MKFKKYHRFSQPYWFNGIYKIVQYEYYGNPARPMPKGEYCYQVFKLNTKQWGNYLDRSIQDRNEPLTFKQCVELAEKHAETYTPCKQQLKQADISRDSWLEMDKSNLNSSVMS